MKEELISFETAKLAKEKGFDILVYDCYNRNGEIGDRIPVLTNFNGFPLGGSMTMISAPTQSLLQRWLRVKHNLIIEIRKSYMSGWYFLIYLKNLPVQTENYLGNTFELTLEKGLFEALKLIK